MKGHISSKRMNVCGIYDSFFQHSLTSNFYQMEKSTVEMENKFAQMKDHVLFQGEVVKKC